MLHALELVEGGEPGVLVGEVHDQAHHHLLVVAVVEEPAAVGY